MEWISVTDKLPTENGAYLCYLNRGLKLGETRSGDPPFTRKIDIFNYYVTPMVPGHQHRVPFWDATSWAGDISKYITHWMPLPSAPLWMELK